ncbi:MAG: zinc ribbon domain-containing protein [Bacilli bacterium]|nr:zinc ribbon domain-containing protein [Bacilli bacterium]
MNCPKCGTLNNINSSFCLKCGTPLAMQQNVVSSEVYTQTYNQSAMTDLQSVSKPFHIIAYMIALLMKPWTCFREEQSKLSDTKTAFLLAGIVGILMMFVNLIKTFISVIFIKKMNYSTWKMETKIDFRGLKDLDYLSLIGKNLLIYIGIIIAIAAIYYLAILVIKRSSKFQTILSITASSFIPFLIFSMFLAPILGKVWNILEIILIIIGFIYAITIFMTLMNDNISFENQDHKIYFHAVCTSIIIFGGYYTCLKLLESELGGVLSFLG